MSEKQDDLSIDEAAQAQLIRQIAYMVSEGTPGDVEEQDVIKDSNTEQENPAESKFTDTH
jgi:hypothetical protein